MLRSPSKLRKKMTSEPQSFKREYINSSESPFTPQGSTNESVGTNSSPEKISARSSVTVWFSICGECLRVVIPPSSAKLDLSLETSSTSSSLKNETSFDRRRGHFMACSITRTGVDGKPSRYRPGPQNR